MQTRLAAGFLVMAMLFVLLGHGISKLGLDPISSTILTACSYLIVGLGASWTISRLLTRRMRVLAAAAAVMREGMALAPVAALNLEAEVAALHLAGADAAEGFAAFRARRKPQFP